MITSDSCVDTIEERNSGGGNIVAHADVVSIDSFRSFLNVGILYL